ncbi:putative peptidase DUF31 [Mycoplasmopsis mustelae]|uniref:Putative peptidase DUF31 n=1 Tax=Mycoplasmopsis mustelae TaxID=171289 RepID=A0A4R7UCB3_9BACT|nr:putative peptidase DUF31 [Mycoplasmopsis mustelae]
MISEVPTLPKDFKFPVFDPSKNNQYPEYAKEYQTVDRNVIYKEIFDRSFAIKFGIGKKINNTDNDFRSTGTGTAWLLDYYKENENKYKLFFATNLHVASDLSNTLDDALAEKLNYQDPRNIRANSISIGKASKRENFDVQTNNYKYQSNQANNVHWYTSESKFTDANKSDSGASVTTLTQGISAPKLIFAGFDFIKREYIQPLQAELRKKAQEWLKTAAPGDEDDEGSEYNIIKKQLLNSETFYPFYTDFAIFEIDIDMSNMNETTKTSFKDAINAVDSYIQRLSDTPKLPNQDKSISKYMQTTDYMTAYFEKYSTNNQNLWNSKQVYIGGYPQLTTDGMATWSINNPNQRTSTTEKYNTRGLTNDKQFALPSNSSEEKITTGNFNPYGKAQGRLLGDYYGYNYSIWFSSLYYGASGSVVYNEFGQIIGIYDSVNSSVEPNDLSKIAGFAPLLLAKDVARNNVVLKAYNLIDGSDKSKYPAQTASYRENLTKIYPNGFDRSNGGNSFKTALFPNGFKIQNS